MSFRHFQDQCYESLVTALESARQDFPILDQHLGKSPLVYLDNAASTQKPRQVLDASREYYEKINANIHRGVHQLSQRATAAHETARQTVAAHLNAARPEEIIFTSGTTDSINLVSSILAKSGLIGRDDEIIISALEHHSNIVPWQMLCEQVGAKLKVIPVFDDGTLDLETYSQLLSAKTKMVAVTHISNAFGTINDVSHIIRLAKEVGAFTLLDGAQSVAHLDIDVQLLNCDFYVFSGHKIYAPTGIGVLYGKHDLLTSLPPWKGGGEMIKEVTFEKTTYNIPPLKYEAGTPNIEGGIALAAAVDYVNNLGIQAIAAHEHQLIAQAAEDLQNIPGIFLYGPPDRSGALSFNIDGIHPYDLGTLLDQMGFALRTGHHCCQPLMARFGVSGTLRASFALYNTMDEVKRLAPAIERAVNMLR